MMPKVIKYSDPIIEMAERTGLEPATPGVTGRYSNQLNYRSIKPLVTTEKWRSGRDSNPRPPA